MPCPPALASSPDPLAPASIRRIAVAYLGTPYQRDSLGEGRGPDPDPLFRRDRVDCQTLVEQVLAESLAAELGGVIPAMLRLRYRSESPILEDRHHYCIPDWLRWPWPAVDITARVGGSHLVTIRRTVHRQAPLASHGLRGARVPAETVVTQAIPLGAARHVAARIPGGTIVVFLSRRSDQVAGHVGLLFHDGQQPVLLHAAESRGRVVAEPLNAWLQRNSRRYAGLKVLQPDRAGMRRRPPTRQPRPGITSPLPGDAGCGGQASPGSAPRISRRGCP